MIYFYYSLDFGFLKNKIDGFKKKYPNYKTLKNPENIEEIAIALLQPTIFNEISMNQSAENDEHEHYQHSFIIEEFSCPISELESLLKQIDKQKVNLLIVKISSKSSDLNINPDLFENKELKIEALNKKRHKEYIYACNKKANLSSSELDLIVSKINKSVMSINDLFNDINTYKLTHTINKEVLNVLLAFHNPDMSFFDFFKLYFSPNQSAWIHFLTERLLRTSDIESFLRIFSYKLYDFYLFLNPRHFVNKNAKWQKSTHKTHNLFSLSEYKKIYENYENNIKNYLNDLIYKFVLFTSSFNSNKNIFDIQYFFLTNYIGKSTYN